MKLVVWEGKALAVSNLLRVVGYRAHVKCVLWPVICSYMLVSYISPCILSVKQHCLATFIQKSFAN